MARRTAGRPTPQEVRAILRQTSEETPEAAIRLLARQQLDGYLNLFGGDGPPINMEALASYRSIKTVAEPPAYSEDAELIPDGARGVLMRINRDRPVTRQRFSVGHEVGHTLFPGYDTEVQCRKPRLRDWHDPKDIVEYLCDVASSEFLFPLAWFQDDLNEQAISAERLSFLAGRYKASPEATVRRFIDLTSAPVAAVFFSWKLKPSEKPLRSARGQKSLLGMVAGGPVPKLRIDYSVANDAFDALGHHVPIHKSVHPESVIHQAATHGVALDAAREHIDLGAFAGWFQISALPLFTQDLNQGPDGESGVVAILQPTSKPRSR